MFEYRYQLISEEAFDLVFANKIDIKINRLIQSLARYLLKNISRYRGIIDLIPAYHTLTVYFDPLLTSYQEAKQSLNNLLNSDLFKNSSFAKRIIEIPVCYDDEFGPDLKDLAEYAKMSVDQLIETHTNSDYYIYMLGFLPGFAYMGTVIDRIAMPRLAQPRKKLEAGSVGIAGKQTGMYPVQSPGGWRIIGRTPLILYDPDRPEPRYRAGDYIRFKSISKEQYEQIREQDRAGEYKLNTISGESDEY